MYTMTDDCLALTVAEATMQDWLAAVTVMRSLPTPLYVAPAPTQPVVQWPPVSRMSARPVRRAHVPAAVGARESENGVAGARPFYWMALAVAVGVFAFL